VVSGTAGDMLVSIGGTPLSGGAAGARTGGGTTCGGGAVPGILIPEHEASANAEMTSHAATAIRA
jgi:hypothetical protein